MGGVALWMRIVGAFYLVMCAATLARQPIRVEGPPGVLEAAAEGDPTARFVIDTWVTLGLLLGVLGGSLLYHSGASDSAGPLIVTVIAVELAWGIPVDIYKMLRGYKKPELVVWIVIHSVIAGTGLYIMTQAGG